MASSSDNIQDRLDDTFENHNFLPQKLLMEDVNQGFFDLIKRPELTLDDPRGIKRRVPVIFLDQELWAEKKKNWKYMTNENGEEISRPFIVIGRKAPGRGSNPERYTIPGRKFNFLRVPIFDGTLKGYTIYKIPQPVYVDMKYDVTFVTHYLEDVDAFYEMMYDDLFREGQAYMRVGNYYIRVMVDDPSEDNDVSIESEKIYNITFPATAYAKIVDPRKFEKVKTITKVSMNITEK